MENANEEMEHHVFELQWKTRSHDWSSQWYIQLKQLWNWSLKKIQAWMGFEPITSGSLLYQQGYQANWELVTFYWYIMDSQCDQVPVAAVQQ